jgi:hypothetical protein
MRSAIGFLLRVSLIIAAIVFAPAGGTAQEPIDLALMLGTALKEFETSNGPIIEVEPQVSCPGETPVEPEPCSLAEVDSVIAHHAEVVGARMEAADSPLPLCRWSEVDAGDRMGVRLSAAVREQRDGSLSVSVTVGCVRDPEDAFGGFLQSNIYPFGYVDGEWRRVGDVITIIT